ncbi:unnamed protein product [Nesidiocoris tenuis]|uniref:Uncharacterized protein n=1 Tax=Nesidiocoris tenuis TaxID=355587 RepID=A0A6H5GEN9_9HEMI|nr:unnamed protein product [Nesidiocoris tenuis]
MVGTSWRLTKRVLPVREETSRGYWRKGARCYGSSTPRSHPPIRRGHLSTSAFSRTALFKQL